MADDRSRPGELQPAQVRVAANRRERCERVLRAPSDPCHGGRISFATCRLKEFEGRFRALRGLVDQNRAASAPKEERTCRTRLRATAESHRKPRTSRATAAVPRSPRTSRATGAFARVAEDVEGHGASAHEDAEDVEGHGGVPPVAEDVEGHGGVPPVAEDVEAHGGVPSPRSRRRVARSFSFLRPGLCPGLFHAGVSRGDTKLNNSPPVVVGLSALESGRAPVVTRRACRRVR